jgi:RecJ-like exonuclease
MDSECSNCHGPAYKFTKPSTTCTNCHIHWDVGVFDHSVIGLTLNEDHEEEDCEVCHIDRDFRVVPTCDNCHDEISYPDDLPGEKY